MEAFAAVGLASNVVQFIETVFKIIKSTREIHHSACSGTQNHIELEAVFKDLHQVSERLKTHRKGSPEPPADVEPDVVSSANNPGIEGLALQCEILAEGLTKTILGLKVQNGSQSIMRCCGKALKAVWKKNEIEELCARATTIRQELGFHLQVENT